LGGSSPMMQWLLEDRFWCLGFRRPRVQQGQNFQWIVTWYHGLGRLESQDTQRSWPRMTRASRPCPHVTIQLRFWHIVTSLLKPWSHGTLSHQRSQEIGLLRSFPHCTGVSSESSLQRPLYLGILASQGHGIMWLSTTMRSRSWKAQVSEGKSTMRSRSWEVQVPWCNGYWRIDSDVWVSGGQEFNKERSQEISWDHFLIVQEYHQNLASRDPCILGF
jgi:hypothetical protein